MQDEDVDFSRFRWQKWDGRTPKGGSSSPVSSAAAGFRRKPSGVEFSLCTTSSAMWAISCRRHLPNGSCRWSYAVTK